MIGTRLSDDIALTRSFNTEQEFQRWEKGLRRAIFANAETAAQRVHEAAQRYSGNELTRRAFAEGMQYGYYASGGWGEPRAPMGVSTLAMSKVLGEGGLSGLHEDVDAWKRSLTNDKTRQAGMSGYSTGGNLAKNVQSVVSTSTDLADYFTVFSLESRALKKKQKTIGSLLTDLRRSYGGDLVNIPTDFDRRVRDVVDALVAYFRTHTQEEYDTYLRGFSAGYVDAPMAVTVAKRPLASSSSAEKRSRIESLYDDITQSNTSRTQGPESEAYQLGRRLGVHFYQTAVVENKTLAVRLLDLRYDEAMERYARLQRHPILAKANSALRPIFVSDDINLLAPATAEEFELIFADAENTIDKSAFREDFDAPNVSNQLHNRMDIFNKIFSSRYGTQSLRQNDPDVLYITKKIIENEQGTDVSRAIEISPEDAELIYRHLLTTDISALDGDVTETPTQRELNAIRAYEYYIQSSVVLLDQNSRDVAALLLTPLLVNTMANYVDRTTSLSRILKLFPPQRPLNDDIRAFLKRYVRTMNEKWLAKRVNIVAATLFSSNYLGSVTDEIAADVGFYLMNDTITTKHGLVDRAHFRYGASTPFVSDMNTASYLRIVKKMGVGKHLRASTRSLFSWLLINNQLYWPEDVLAMQTVIHDVAMLRYLFSEMEQRADMVRRVLFFNEQGTFSRWDLTDFLAQREKEIDSSSSSVDFAQTAQRYIESLNASPNTDYVQPPEPPSVSPTLLPFEEEVLSDDNEHAIGNFSASYSSSWEAKPFGVMDDGTSVSRTSSSMILARMAPERISVKLAARQQGVVLRDISALDGPSAASYPQEADVHYVGAYYGHAFGPQLGRAAFSRRDKKVVLLESCSKNAAGVRSLLASHIGELYPDSSVDVGEDFPSESQPIEPEEETLHDLDVDISMSYRPNLAEHNNETPHGIFLYLSSTYSPSPPVFVPAADAIAAKRLVLRFKSRYPEITGHALFNVDSYAKTRDVGSDACVNQAGFASVRLADLAAKRTASLTLRVPNSDEQKIKGDVLVTVHSVSLPVRKDSTVRSADDLKKMSAAVQKMIQKYIDSNRRFYREHPNVVESVQNITVFEYAARQGIVPGSLFDSFKLAPSVERYYLQAIQYVLRRRRPDADIPVDEWMRLDDATKTHILMDVLRLYVNYCTYIRDLVDNNTATGRWSSSNVELIESFDYIRQRDAGDCEDFSREILQAAMELKHNLRDSTSPAIQELRRIANQFTFASVLCGVSREAMSLGELSKGRVHLHGHECAVAIPNHVFFEALRRNDPDHPAFQLYTQEELNAGQGEQIYVLEGTGCLFPEPRVKTDFFAHVEKEFQRATAVSKKADMVVFYHPSRDDGFYKQMITLLTPELFLRTGHLGFEFLVCRHVDGALKRGVPFSMLIEIEKNADVQIVPAPTMSPDVFRASTRMNADDFPPIALEPGLLTPEMRDVSAELTTGRPSAGQDFFQFHVKFDYMNRAYIDALKRFAAQHRLGSFCLAEPVKLSASTGQNVGGYTIMLF